MTVAVVTVIERSKVAAINDEHELCARSYKDAVVHAAECGRMLAEVKADLSHGDWLPWLAEHFAASADTAQLYMRIAANPERVPDLRGVRDAKAQLAKPRQTDVASMLRGLNAGADPDDATHIDRDRLDRAQDRLREQTATLWSDQHHRRRQRILDLLDEVRAGLDDATDTGLSAEAITELLRDCERRARQASAQLGELAFSFE